MRSKIIILLLCIFLTGCQTKTYTITFDTNGGEVMDSITIKNGDTISEITTPKKDGYLFVSWLKDGLEYNENNPINEDITLTASWVEIPTILNNYTVTFVNCDKVEQTKVKEFELIKEPTIPKRENYLFLGWYVGDELYDFNTKVTKDIILTAKYKLDVVTVTYDLDGGEGLAIETIPKGENISIPNTPIKKGYKFIKWTLNDKDFSFTTKIDEDITLKAIWEKIEYVTITYDTDGGTPIEPTTIEKYSKINTLPIPKKEGYIFQEWQLDGVLFNIDRIIQDDITIKAIYKIDTGEQ